MSFEYTPSLTVNSEGETVPDYNQGTLQQSRDLHRGLGPQGFEIDEETGEHFIFEDEEGPVDSNDEYMASIGEAFPELSEALTHAHTSMDSELLATFYKAAEEGNYDEFHEILYIIISEYEEHLEQTSTPEEDDSDSIEELEDNTSEDVEIPDISSLYQTEPDAELSDTFSDLADSSEGVEKLLYQLSARYHSNTGESADDLIEIALSSGYSRSQLINAFNLLNDSNE